MGGPNPGEKGVDNPSEDVQNRTKKKPDGPLEVESGGCEHDVDGVPEEALVEVAPEAVVRLAVPDDRLDARPLPEQPVLLLPNVPRIALSWRVWDYDCGVPRPLHSPVAAVARKHLDLPPVYPPHLLKRLFHGVPVELVAERQRADDEAAPVPHHRHLVAELVFLVLLVLVVALLLGLVDGVDLALVIAFLVDTLMKMLICSS